MNALDDGRQWRDMADHLAEAHGAHADSLIGYAPTLEQLCFVHADTHVALASANVQPPDRHTHPLPINAGWVVARESSYRPFPPSASAQGDPFFIDFPLPHQTGLPQTCISGLTEADLAGWAAMRPLEHVSASAVVHHAACASARWLTRVSFPDPAQPRVPMQPGRDGTRHQARLRRAAGTATTARQPRSRSQR